MASAIDTSLIEQGIGYEAFRNRVEELYEQGLPTSGDPNSDIPLLEFTKLNMKRMDRIHKNLELDHTITEKLLDLPEQLYWVVFVEGWCGDVAQNLPVIAKMADVTDKVDLRLLWRDQYPEAMDHYLTNGGRSIPKLVALRASDFKELGTWGPRPQPVQEMILAHKQQEEQAGKSKKEMIDDLHEKMHKWYAKDKNKTLQEEFVTLLENWNQELLEATG